MFYEKPCSIIVPGCYDQPRYENPRDTRMENFS